ncbi:MAG TPA: hypothetical protein DCP69_07985 [Candidatus Omnitrophica bacterium]|nr:hypothetical protein [Candidatus Omnitrophota bacterium]
MTPDQIAALTAISAIMAKVGTWPIGSIVTAIVFGPWVVMGLLSRSMEKRHEAALKMYEENVKLVINYEKVAEGLQDIIILSTQTMTQVRERIDANLFCPIMRKDKKVEIHPS